MGKSCRTMTPVSGLLPRHTVAPRDRKTLETPATCAGLKGCECCTMAPPGGRPVQEHDLRTQTWTLHQIIIPPASEMEAPLSQAPGGPEDVSRMSLPSRTSWSHWKTWPPRGQRCHWDAWTCGSKGPTRREGGPRRCRDVHHRSPRPPWSAGHSRFSWISGSHWARRQTGPSRTKRGDGPDGSPRTAGTSRTKRRKGSVWRVPTPG